MEGQPGSQLPIPGPARPSTQASCPRAPTAPPIALGAQGHESLGEPSQGHLHTATPHSGDTPPTSPCPGPLRLQVLKAWPPPWTSLGLASQLGVSTGRTRSADSGSRDRGPCPAFAGRTSQSRSTSERRFSYLENGNNCASPREVVMRKGEITHVNRSRPNEPPLPTARSQQLRARSPGLARGLAHDQRSSGSKTKTPKPCRKIQPSRGAGRTGAPPALSSSLIKKRWRPAMLTRGCPWSQRGSGRVTGQRLGRGKVPVTRGGACACVCVSTEVPAPWCSEWPPRHLH